jgi:hypothetical protein
MNPKSTTHLWNRVWHHAQQTLPQQKKQPRHQLKLAYNNMKISGFQSVVIQGAYVLNLLFFLFPICLLSIPLYKFQMH